MKSLESGHEMQTKLMSTAHVWPTLAWTLSQEMTLGWWSSLIFRAQRNLPNISDTLVTQLTWRTSVSLMMTSMWSALEETTAVYLCGDVCKCQKPLMLLLLLLPASNCRGHAEVPPCHQPLGNAYHAAPDAQAQNAAEVTQLLPYLDSPKLWCHEGRSSCKMLRLLASVPETKHYTY